MKYYVTFNSNIKNKSGTMRVKEFWSLSKRVNLKQIKRHKIDMAIELDKNRT